jgi:hypothetical protein
MPVFAMCTIPDSLKEGGNVVKGKGTGIGGTAVIHRESWSLKLKQLTQGEVVGLGVCGEGYACQQPRWANAWTVLSGGQVYRNGTLSSHHHAKFGEGAVVKLMVIKAKNEITLRWSVDGEEREALTDIPVSEPLFFCAGSFGAGAIWEGMMESAADAARKGLQFPLKRHREQNCRGHGGACPEKGHYGPYPTGNCWTCCYNTVQFSEYCCQGNAPQNLLEICKTHKTDWSGKSGHGLVPLFDSKVTVGT